MGQIRINKQQHSGRSEIENYLGKTMNWNIIFLKVAKITQSFEIYRLKDCKENIDCECSITALYVCVCWGGGGGAHWALGSNYVTLKANIDYFNICDQNDVFVVGMCHDISIP